MCTCVEGFMSERRERPRRRHRPGACVFQPMARWLRSRQNWSGACCNHGFAVMGTFHKKINCAVPNFLSCHTQSQRVSPSNSLIIERCCLTASVRLMLGFFRLSSADGGFCTELLKFIETVSNVPLWRGDQECHLVMICWTFRRFHFFR